MMNNDLMLYAILIPIIASPIVFFLGKKIGRVWNGILSTVALTMSTALLFSYWNPVLSSGPITESYGIWIGLFKLDISFLMDYLSLPIVLLISGISTLVALYSITYMTHEHDQEIYFTCMLLFVAGMIGVVLASNLILFYLFWEMMLIPSYFLIAYWGSGRPRIIGFKYFMFTHAGAACLFFGILWAYALGGTFNMMQLSAALQTAPLSSLKWIMMLMFIGFAVKLAIFPVHTWLPDAHAEAPTPISVLLSGVMIKCGAYAMARITLAIFPSTVITVSYVLLVLAVITMLWGGIMAFAQTDIKRLLAYSSISQAGYIVFGLMSLYTLGIAGGLFHILNHGIAKALLFMVAGAIIYTTGIRDINKLGGLAAKMPITTVAALCGALSIAGTPPFGGFASEWMIFAGAFQAEYMLLGALAIIATIITVGYYLRMIKKVFFGTSPRSLGKVKEAPIYMLIPLSILTFFTIIYGIFPHIPMEVLYPAAESIGKLFIGG